MAWKPPSTWTISPLIPRAKSESRKQIVSATGPGSSTSQPERRLDPPQRRPAARSRGSRAPPPYRAARPRPGSPGSRGARDPAPGSARPTRAPPWPPPSSRRSATRRWRRSPARRCSRRRPSAARPPRPAPSSRTRWSGTRPIALSAGVVMKRPPSASSGAKAIACSTPSTPPHLARSDSVSAAKDPQPCSRRVRAHRPRRSSRFAARSVIRRARPKLVKTTEAPSRKPARPRGTRSSPW